MSMEALNWAWSVDCTSTQKLVLVALADRADTEGVCWPSVKQTALRCSLSRKATQLALKALSKREVISWDDFTDNQNRTRHRFTLNMRTTFAREPDSPVNDVPPPCEPDTHPPVNDVPPPCEPRSRTPRMTFAQTLIEPTGNPNSESKVEPTHPPSPPQGGSVRAHSEDDRIEIAKVFEAVTRSKISGSIALLWVIAISRQWKGQTYHRKPATFAKRVVSELVAIGADLSVEPKKVSFPGEWTNSGNLSWPMCAFEFISQRPELESKARRLAISWSTSLHNRASLSTHDTWQDDLSAFVKIKTHAGRRK